MRKFVLKFIIFCFLFLSVIAIWYSYLYFSKQNTIVRLVNKNIIIGDSNTKWSMNDKTISGYSNFSTGGELYLFAYNKLKIFDQHNKIDTLLLSFSPHNIINNMWWNDDEGTPLDNRMGGFYDTFSLENHLDLLINTPKSYIGSLSNIGAPIIRNLFNISSFWSSPSKKTNSTNNIIIAEENIKYGSYLPNPQNETQFKPEYWNYKKLSFAKIELKYLHKIIDECKKKKIYLILIQPPKNYLRKDYKNYDFKEFYDYYDKNLNLIDFLDFSKLRLPKHAYWNIMHVDIVGAEYFSNFINKNKIKNLLHSKYNRKNINKINYHEF